MDNPIILLIFWGLINLFLKSSKDKKKAEEAKRRRINQANLSQNTSTKKKPKSIIDVFKEEIQKEIQREKEAQERKQVTKPYPQKSKSSLVSEKKPEELKKGLADYYQANRSDDEVGQTGELELVRISNSHGLGKRSSKSSINFKKDILKGIIYSEILSEPKGLKNMKR